MRWKVSLNISLLIYNKKNNRSAKKVLSFKIKNSLNSKIFNISFRFEINLILVKNFLTIIKSNNHKKPYTIIHKRLKKI